MKSHLKASMPHRKPRHLDAFKRRMVPKRMPKHSAALLVALFAKLLWVMPAHATQPAVQTSERGVKPARVRIAEGGWGATPVTDLQTVLDAVAREMSRHFPGRDPGPIEVIAAGNHPMVLYDKGPRGEYVIQLSARDARWYQFVYQFSHELCHVYSNYDNKPRLDGQVVSHNQWFEESLCEAAALFTLRKLAASWEADPAAGVWRDYAPTLRQYADLLMGEAHRHLPAGRSLPAWFREHHPDMQANPYLRQQDEVVSGVLLPLFEANPDNWGAIAYLNAEKGDAALSFDEYLEAWCLACPQEFRGFVEAIIALFKAPAAESIQTASAAH